MTDPTKKLREHSTLYMHMLQRHEYLRALCVRLLAAMEANASDDVRAFWNELDHGLLSHMEAEERYVLPAFMHIDADEARAIVREHGLIREMLLELGVAVDLHQIRYRRGIELVDLLLQHAEREEKLLYRWADEHLGPDIVQAVKQRTAA
jgi:hypothetical protein